MNYCRYYISSALCPCGCCSSLWNPIRESSAHLVTVRVITVIRTFIFNICHWKRPLYPHLYMYIITRVHLSILPYLFQIVHYRKVAKDKDVYIRETAPERLNFMNGFAPEPTYFPCTSSRRQGKILSVFCHCKEIQTIFCNF